MAAIDPSFPSQRKVADPDAFGEVLRALAQRGRFHLDEQIPDVPATLSTPAALGFRVAKAIYFDLLDHGESPGWCYIESENTDDAWVLTLRQPDEVFQGKCAAHRPMAEEMQELVRSAPTREAKKPSLLERLQGLFGAGVEKPAPKAGEDLVRWLTERDERFTISWRLASHTVRYLRQVFEMQALRVVAATRFTTTGIGLTGDLETFATGHFGVRFRDKSTQTTRAEEHQLIRAFLTQEGPVSRLVLQVNPTAFSHVPIRNLWESASNSAEHYRDTSPVELGGMEITMEGLCLLFERLYGLR